MSHRRDHTDIDFERRQRATLPPDIIRNDAHFEGTLIKGGRPLTALQRTGTVIVGLFFLLPPSSVIVALVQSRMKGEPVFDSSDGLIVRLVATLGALIVSGGFGYCGVRMLKNSFMAPRKR